MKSNNTRQEYIKRVNYVLDFIEKNLEASLSLETLSKRGHYSTFHFHRVFSIIVGETLNEYLNRKRIERIASILLLNTNTPIKELAYNYGFNSQSSFSRAFKKYYGVSPTRFKSDGITTLRKIGIEPFSTERYIRSIDDIKKWIDMNAQIGVKELRETKLAGIMHIGEFEEIGNMYQRLMEWGHKRGLLSTSDFKTITIYHDNPNVTQISKVRYSACVSVNKNIDADGEIRPYKIPKGYYAVGNFEIEANDFPKAWKSMSVWVIENNYKFRDGDYFEIYLNDHKTHPEQKFIIDIYIPLEKTQNIKLGRAHTLNFSQNKTQSEQCGKELDYHYLINYMKELRAFFLKEYDTCFRLGNIYQGNPNFSYFSLATTALKNQKLKFVIILNHKELYFSICLSGQNKIIRKKYWEIFKDSDWKKYHLAESIDNSLSIIEQIIVKEPNFNNKRSLTKKIEKESMKFMEELKTILQQ
ncbi:AraC family transcriptional regulator [Flagellimonas sp. HMM57]|uniref:AraC family transcriptional regulator n=1 Tax=unclassified Flagellimonas TaxID=2644544 RepID=UPI0013D7E5C2|nr:MULTISPECIES: AraC family transcriptional regulator [unclassified Flagellimonas]UII75339.1 AraC family transcriptional regulator [Flagellimonas sp. HMM57]